MSDVEAMVLDLLDEAIKHGKHNQASHGRRTARRRAYSAAYSQARAGGATPQEARAKAKDAGLARQSERDKRLERLRAFNAPEARAERERVAKEKADQEAKERLVSPPTPVTKLFALTGSEKQISWATRIRADVLDEAVKERKRLVARGLNQQVSDKQFAEVMNRFDKGTEALRTKTSSSWWIDRRNNSLVSLLREVTQ